jgi:outer membrane protein TolC
MAGATLVLEHHASAEELTAASAADRAAQTSFDIAAARDARDAAEARVDQALSGFIPRVGVSARYTRLSDFTPLPLFPFNLVATDAPAGTVSPQTVSAGAVSTPPILDNYTLGATLTVPITDYVLRLPDGADAARRGRDAADWDSVSAESRARLQGRIAFYEWLRAVALVDAAKQSLAEQRTQLADVTIQVRESNASRADLLRVDGAVAGAEALVAEAAAQRTTAEVQLRTLLHLPSSEPLTTHETFDGTLESVAERKAEWLKEADQRAELRGFEAAEAASRAQASVARASYVPTVVGFANAEYANPNPRYFPPVDAWHATWAVGLSATWTLTDIPGARALSKEADARAAAFSDRRNAFRDAIGVEVAQYFDSGQAADARIVATDKQLESATEAYRVTRSLFANARATTSNLLDAETELSRARFASISARIDARITRARLDHAIGRDQRPAAR